MVKKTKQTKKNKNPIRNKVVHGPVSSISSAPVSIGNSIRGSEPRSTNYQDGARVVGRDFAFSLGSTAATITGWELIGGMPITPSVMPSSILRNYSQMYCKFKVNKLIVHYITSSPTNQAGDILFYYEHDRFAPMVDYSNASFLAYVLSDKNTVIGPQWTNHSIAVRPAGEWKTTLYGNQTDLNEDAAGSIFLFSKTNAANSPGYILLDYDITFKEMAVNPRAGTLPIARGQAFNLAFGQTTNAVTLGTAYTYGLQGKDLTNNTPGYPTGVTNGDIYKCVACATASTVLNTWTNVTLSTLFSYNSNIDTPILIDDGFTFYLTIVDYTVGASTATFLLYPTFDLAASNGVSGSASGALRSAVTATVTWTLIANVMLVGNLSTLTQSAY